MNLLLGKIAHDLYTLIYKGMQNLGARLFI